MKESIVRFGTEDSLVGIFTDPELAFPTGNLPGFILLNSGVIHRAGPNRLYVNAARRLAFAGYPVLRFDLSGIGDSCVRSDTLPFGKSAVIETTEAMSFLKEQMDIDRFVLAGICSGADISFLTAVDNPDVVGVVLINGRGLHGVTDDAGDEIVEELKNVESARYLYKSALFNLASWKKLIYAKVDYGQLALVIAKMFVSWFKQIARPTAAALGIRESFHFLLKRGVRLLLVYSEGDPGLDYLQKMLGNQVKACSRYENFSKVIVDEADHTFTLRQSQDNLIKVITEWVQKSH